MEDGRTKDRFSPSLARSLSPPAPRPVPLPPAETDHVTLKQGSFCRGPVDGRGRGLAVPHTVGFFPRMLKAFRRIGAGTPHESWPVCQPGHSALLIPHTWPFESRWARNLHPVRRWFYSRHKGDLLCREYGCPGGGPSLHLFFLLGLKTSTTTR